MNKSKFIIFALCLLNSSLSVCFSTNAPTLKSRLDRECKVKRGSLFWEGNILDYIKEFLPESPNILEAGAHHGEDTDFISKKWPSGTIYAFEPLPFSYEKLVEKTKSATNVKAFQYALSDTIGNVPFYVCESGDSASSLLAPQAILNGILAFKPEPILVEATTIDKWAAENGITSIDFMWLDMEGNELRALKASPNILTTVKVIYTEVNFQEFREGNAFYDEIKEFLENLGFEEKWSHVNTSWQGNVLFVRK